MSFQVGIGSLDGTLYPSEDFGNQSLKLFVNVSYLGGLKERSHLID